jgi:hypothetical protein
MVPLVCRWEVRAVKHKLDHREYLDAMKMTAWLDTPVRGHGNRIMSTHEHHAGEVG